jgi:hypothetical protein
MDKYKIRIAKMHELSNILALINGNLCASIDLRAKDLYEFALSQEMVHVVEAANGSLTGVSIIFLYGESLPFAEIGSTIMTGPKGHPFYEVVIASQVLHFYLISRFGRKLIANINSSNRSTARRLRLNLGFRDFIPPVSVLDENTTQIGKSPEDVKWYYCPISALAKHAEIIYNQHLSPQSKNKKGQQIEIYVDSLPILSSSDCLNAILGLINT